ncbi:hypothetical protein F4859DRAFT_520502 [Xylaria cf. heliscus]|nr:hypothetical protein F4859DRAFT_520502 [Xylaria cf. heliscus]
MAPRAQSQSLFGQRAPGREAEIFTPGMSWALCFFHGRNDPHVQEFRPPNTAYLYQQSVAIYIPYHVLYRFAGHRRANMTLQPYLQDRAAHCRLKVFESDERGLPLQWRYTFHVYWDQHYRDEHFKFVGELMPPGYGEKRINFYAATYFIECEFYKGHAEPNIPDATYTTGLFDVI